MSQVGCGTSVHGTHNDELQGQLGFEGCCQLLADLNAKQEAVASGVERLAETVSVASKWITDTVEQLTGQLVANMNTTRALVDAQRVLEAQLKSQSVALVASHHPASSFSLICTQAQQQPEIPEQQGHVRQSFDDLQAQEAVPSKVLCDKFDTRQSVEFSCAQRNQDSGGRASALPCFLPIPCVAPCQVVGGPGVGGLEQEGLVHNLGMSGFSVDGIVHQDGPGGSVNAMCAHLSCRSEEIVEAPRAEYQEYSEALPRGEAQETNRTNKWVEAHDADRHGELPRAQLEEEVDSCAELFALDFSVGDAACAGPCLENSGDDREAQAEPQQPVRQGGHGVPAQITFLQSAFQLQPQ